MWYRPPAATSVPEISRRENCQETHGNPIFEKDHESPSFSDLPSKQSIDSGYNVNARTLENKCPRRRCSWQVQLADMAFCSLAARLRVDSSVADTNFHPGSWLVSESLQTLADEVDKVDNSSPCPWPCTILAYISYIYIYHIYIFHIYIFHIYIYHIYIYHIYIYIYHIYIYIYIILYIIYIYILYLSYIYIIHIIYIYIHRHLICPCDELFVWERDALSAFIYIILYGHNIFQRSEVCRLFLTVSLLACNNACKGLRVSEDIFWQDAFV